MNIFSTENRTRTYHPRQSRPFDDRFDRELPQEARAELRRQQPAPPPPPEEVHRPIAKPPPPAKRLHNAALLGAVVLAVAFLYTVSRTGGPSSRTPPENRVVPTPSPVEVRRALPIEVRRALPVWVEVRRALPAVPRALPVTSSVSNVSQWQLIKFPDGTLVPAALQGELPSSSSLPSQGRFIGEEWSTGNTTWIWMTPSRASFPSWVDP